MKGLTKTKISKGNRIKGCSCSMKKTAAEAGFIFSLGFIKQAGGPGSGVAHPNTMAIDFLETSPLMSIGKRQEFMDSHTPVETNLSIDYKSLKYKGQEKMVPKKVVRILIHADDALKKPIDVIRDENGDYHILDGHHRGIVAILLKRRLRANVYIMDNVIKKVAEDLELGTEEVPFVHPNVVRGLAKGDKDNDLDRKRDFAMGYLPPTSGSKERIPLSGPKGDTARPESFQ